METRSMWRILTVCLLAVSIVGAHHDGTDSDHKDEDQKAVIMLEIQPLGNSSNNKDKRSPQQSSEAVYGASPGQFVVRTSNDAAAAPEVPQDYLNLLQQFLAIQQQQNEGAEGQPSSQPVIQQLLVARNPNPSAVQFINDPVQAARARARTQAGQATPQAQLQTLYFNSQFQQQIPVRPRILRPRPPPPAQNTDDFPALTSSQAHSVHEARLRASLAGSDPNLAAQSLTQQELYAHSSPTERSVSVSQQQLAAEDQIPYQAVSQQEIVQPQPQQQQVYAANPEVRYVQQPEQASPSPISYSSSTRQISPSTQVIRTDRVKSSQRAPQQYLRETTQPIPQQTLIRVPEQHQTVIRVPEPQQTLIRVPEQQQTLIRVPDRQQSSQPSIYLSSQSGSQTPSSGQDDDLISQLLSQSGRGLFPGSSASASSVAEEVIQSTTTLSPPGSRSSIYVTQTSKLKDAPNRGQITLNDVGQEQKSTAVPVVHLPTPDGQRPLTQTEFQALIDAGFNIQPAPESAQTVQYTQNETPQYYQQTTKRQRSYTTPVPPQRNQLSLQSRGKKIEQDKAVQYIQDTTEAGQRGQLSRYQLQGTKPRQQQEEEEHVVVYVHRPAAIQSQNEQQGDLSTRLQIVTDRPNTEDNIQFVQVPTTPEEPEVRQRGHLTRYKTEQDISSPQTHLHLIHDERESLVQQTQPSRYEPESSQSEGLRYQTQSVDIPQQTQSYQLQEEPGTQNDSPIFQPIVVADLPTTTAAPSSTPRRRKPRPSHSRIVFRGHPSNDGTGSQDSRSQYVLSYDNIPEASSFGTRNRVRGRRPTPTEES